jgi:hypothetical protein
LVVGIINWHKCSTLKQHPFMLSQFPWVRSLGMIWFSLVFWLVSPMAKVMLESLINYLVSSPLKLLANSLFWGSRNEVLFLCWLSAGCEVALFVHRSCLYSFSYGPFHLQASNNMLSLSHASLTSPLPFSAVFNGYC